MNRFFLAGLLLRSCSAVSLSRNAKSDRELEACSDAAPGHWCHAAAMWAKTVGYAEHPEWFPGDASQYSLRDFQSLLHSLGEAECSRPCPLNSRGAGSRALGLLEFGESSTAKLVDESAEALDQTSTYGFAPAEFTEMMEESWVPKAMASARGGDKTDEAGCQDAQRGSMCHHAMTFLRTKGIAKHPTWYPSLNGDSTMRDVQEVLHNASKAHCPKPCPDHGAQPLKNFPNDDVIEVFDGGRQVASEAYELKEATGCGDTVEGEWCYNSIMWLKNTGLAKHPDWYPRLTNESSMAAFQAALHGQRKMNCRLPCGSADTESEEEEVSQEDTTATIPNSIATGTEQCEDALEGSHCYKAISKTIDVGLWMHPEKFRGLNSHSSREQVQKHLYLHGKYECGWPCPKEPIDKNRRVAKRVEDMTEKELGRYMSHEWDGYVDSDEYDPHEAVKPSEGETAVGAPAAKSASASAAEEEKRPVAAGGAKESEERGDAATLPSKDENPPKLLPVIHPKRQALPTPKGLKNECRDAQVGELCYSAVTWARSVGILERPQWYTGLSKMSTFREFQAFLHKSRPGICEMPCGNLREARPFEAEAEAADTSEELLPVIDGSGQKFVSTTSTEPTPEPEVQANSTAEEPALEAADNDTSEEALPAVDPDGQEVEIAVEDMGVVAQQPEKQEEANSTEEANAAAEEPAPQPEAATVEAAVNATAVEVMPTNSTAEEPAPQPEAATAEAAEADTSEEALPVVDPDGQELEIDLEDMADIAQQVKKQASEPPSAEDAAMDAEQAAALPGAGNGTEAGKEANSTAEEPAPQSEAATVESDTSEEPLPVVDPDGQELEIDLEDMAAIAQQREADRAQAELRAQVEALKSENAALKANSTVQPAPEPKASEPQSAEDAATEAEQADQKAEAEQEPVPAPQPEANSTAEEEPLLQPGAAAVPANSSAEEPAPQPEAATAEEEANSAAASDDNATSSTSEKAAFARKEPIQPRPRRKAVYSDPLPYVNQQAEVTSIMQERDEEEER